MDVAGVDPLKPPHSKVSDVSKRGIPRQRLCLPAAQAKQNYGDADADASSSLRPCLASLSADPEAR
jgi:hypothetical protein